MTDPFEMTQRYLSFYLTSGRRPNGFSSISEEADLAKAFWNFSRSPNPCHAIVQLFEATFGANWKNPSSWTEHVGPYHLYERNLSQSINPWIKVVRSTEQGERLLNSILMPLLCKGPTYNTASLFFSNDMLNRTYRSYFENTRLEEFDQPGENYNYESNWYIYNNDYNDLKHTCEKMFKAFGLDVKTFSDVLYNAKAIVAGGFPLNCLVKYCAPESFQGDIDIYIPLKDFDKNVSGIIKYLEFNGYKLLKETIADPKNEDLYCDLTNIERLYDFERPGNNCAIQVIVVNSPSALEYVHSFDNSICQTVLHPLNNRSFRLQTPMLYHQLTTRGIMKLLKPVAYDTDL
jgi:hypothetical protein